MRVNYKFIFKIVLAILLAFIIVEVGLRFVKYLPPSDDTPCFYKYQNGTVRMFLDEGHTVYKIQNDFFGTNSIINYSKKRIIVLGDSYTVGNQVMPEDNYVNILDKEYKDYNFINAGIAGAALAERIGCKYYFDQIGPSHYLFQVGNNDFTSGSFDKSKKYYFEDVRGKLILKKKERSSFLGKIRKEYPYIFGKFESIQVLQLLYFKSIRSMNKGNGNVESENSDNIWIIDQEMKFISDVYGNDITLVYIPQVPRIINNEIYLGDEDYFKVKSAIFDSAKKYNITIIDPTQEFLQVYDENQFPFGFQNSQPGTGHINMIGHRILADKIEENLKEREDDIY